MIWAHKGNRAGSESWWHSLSADGVPPSWWRLALGGGRIWIGEFDKKGQMMLLAYWLSSGKVRRQHCPHPPGRARCCWPLALCIAPLPASS